jgi:hypothetical protein
VPGEQRLDVGPGNGTGSVVPVTLTVTEPQFANIDLNPLT